MSPISTLTWDPGDLYWKVWVQDHIKYVSFFQYSVKIGRNILDATSWKEPTANVFGRRNVLSPQNLKQFWKWLLGIKMNRKIVCFRWLSVHKAIPVNGWWKGNVGKVCPYFTDLVETSKHCLWNCSFVMDLWKQIIQLLTLVYPRAVYTWGAVLWAIVHYKPIWYMNRSLQTLLRWDMVWWKENWSRWIHKYKLINLKYGNW